MRPIIFSRLLTSIFFVGLCFGLAGCFSPVNTTTPNIYVLNSTPNNIIKAKNHSLTLLVRTPQANPAYNTTQMAYVTEQYQLSYFVKNRWATTPPQMLLPLIIKTLQNTHAFHAVIPPYVNIQTNLILDTQVLQLQQEFTQQSSQVRLVVRAQLSTANTNRVLATREFTIVEPAAANDPYAGVAATNRATSRFLQELAVFCVKNK